MNLLNVPGVFGIAVGIVGLAFIAEAVDPASSPALAENPATTSVSTPSLSGLFSMAARADEMLAGDGEDLSDLLRIDLPHSDVTMNDYVGSNVHSTATVKKIAYGRVSEVNVYSTSTGAYSTDGLESPHVQYPGIRVADWRVHTTGPLSGFVWEGAFGWIPVPRKPTHSFLHYRTTPHVIPAPASRGMDCVEQADVLVCG